MSQKVNPIAVRLRFNRSSDSSWFSDYYYSTLLYQDLNFREYLNSIRQPTANKLGFRLAKCVIHHYPKRSLIHLFCLARKRPPVLRTSTTLGRPNVRTSTPRIVPHLNSEVVKQDSMSSIQNVQRTLANTAQALPISQKKRAVASYLRQSYNFSKHSLNRLGFLHLEFRSHAQNIDRSNSNVLRTSGTLVARKAPTVLPDLAKPNFIANLLELNKACPSATSISAYEKKLANKETSYHRTLRHVNQLLTETGLTSGAIAFRQQAATLAEKLGNKSGFSVAPYVQGGVAYKLGKFSRSLTDFEGAKKSNTQNSGGLQVGLAYKADNESGLLPLTGTCGTPITTTRQSAHLGELYFNILAMQYFFFRKTNSIYEKAPHQTQVNEVLKESKKCEAFFKPSTSSTNVPLGKCRYFYLSNVQSILSDKTSTLTSLRPIKVSSIFKSASLIAQEIACKLEQKKSFRLICRSIFQQISNCNYIKGIRISCSGRLNGAEIAKTECRKYGETSLHVFSDKIDYAQAKASTPYGILGVKVWISYV
jgi:small subunit ribosomal protein S3